MSADRDELLNKLSHMHRSIHRTIETCGIAALTAQRVTETVVNFLLDDDVGVRLCPGYVMHHLWVWNGAGQHEIDFTKRCDKHPDRRTGKERRK